MSTWVIERTVSPIVSDIDSFFKLPDERSETEQMSMGNYTRFLGASAEPSLLVLCRATTEAV